jgi:uncharacterized repeat protein (TIGR02543 family)
VAVKISNYLLTPELQKGKAAIAEALARQLPPPIKPPAVDLELELRNSSPNPVSMIWGGDQSHIRMALTGPSAINGSWPVIMTTEFRMGQEITLASGEVYRIPIKSLGFGPRNIVSGGCWWTEPGQYGLTVSGNYTQADQNVYFSAPVVTLTVAPPPTTLTLIYDVQGGSVLSPATQMVTYAAAYGTLPTPTRAGYTFAGWWTGANGTGSEVTATTIVTVTANHTIYARWTANTYNVSFDAQGGRATPMDKTVTFGQAYGTLLNAACRDGYTCTGWSTGPGGTGTEVTAQTIVSTAKDHTLYAKWVANTYRIFYDAWGGKVFPAGKTVTYASAYGTLPTPARTGYAFAGWWTDIAIIPLAPSAGNIVASAIDCIPMRYEVTDNSIVFVNKVTDSSFVSKASDHILYASWKNIAGILAFSPAPVSATANSGTVFLTVTRNNGSTGIVTVQYRMADGTAKAGTDYTAKTGTLTFATGETSKKISIPILNKGTVLKGDRCFTISLSNPTGGAMLGFPGTAVVTVTPAPALEIAPTTWAAPKTSAILDVAVTSNLVWTVSSSQTWLTLSETSGSDNGSVTLTVEENPTIAVRKAVVTFKAGTLTKTVTVMQAAGDPALWIDPAEWDIAMEGGTRTVMVNSNTRWSVRSSQTWLVPSKTSGTGNSSMTLMAKANATTVSRTATLTFTAPGVASRTIAVTQAGISQTRKTVDLKTGETAEITLAGNPTTGYLWTLTMPGNPAIALVKDLGYTQDPAPEGMVGVGGIFRFEIKGLLQGKTTLVFEYRRPWEKNVAPIKTMTVDVTVR